MGKNVLFQNPNYAKLIMVGKNDRMKLVASPVKTGSLHK